MTASAVRVWCERVSDTARLPPEAQGEALASMFSGAEHPDLAPFVGALIGELVVTREALRPPPRSPPSASPPPS